MPRLFVVFSYLSKGLSMKVVFVNIIEGMLKRLVFFRKRRLGAVVKVVAL
jgi:hypothetical protein